MPNHGLMVTLIIVLILCAGCTGPGKNNGGGGGIVTPSPAPTYPTFEDLQVEYSALSEKSINESNQALADAVKSLAAGNADFLLDSIPGEVLGSSTGTLTISQGQTDAISNALAHAVVIDANPDMVMYHTVYEGKDHSFYTIRRWGRWAIIGF